MTTSCRGAVVSALITAVASGSSLAFAQVQADQVNGDVLQAVMALYGLDEEEAVTRLAKEEAAADLYRRLESDPVRGYGGSWFDTSSLTLKVALSRPEDWAFVEELGAQPIAVDRSLAQLEEALERLKSDQLAVFPRGVVLSSYIDVPNNRIVFGVRRDFRTDVEDRLRSSGGSDFRQHDIVVVGGVVTASATDLRAGDGFRNLTYESIYGGERRCSVGASIVGGFVTAGHCAWNASESIGSMSGAPMGTVTATTYTVRPYDSAWISTNSSWTPTPKINGYSDGIIAVPAKWSGTNEYPVGTTVCRYGVTTGGPHCGTVHLKNVDINMDTTIDEENPTSTPVDDTTLVTGVCSQGGDSGGPLVAALGQLQGTLIGNGTYDGHCATFYQPIVDTLFGAFSPTELVALTAHGAQKPTVSTYVCPDLNNSGDGIFSCRYDHFNSQGKTTQSWSASTGSTSTITELWGTCIEGQTVSVTFALTNPYGTHNQASSFPCPTGPMP